MFVEQAYPQDFLKKELSIPFGMVDLQVNGAIKL
jgi:hypothetical protein